MYCLEILAVCRYVTVIVRLFECKFANWQLIFAGSPSYNRNTVVYIQFWWFVEVTKRLFSISNHPCTVYVPLYKNNQDLECYCDLMVWSCECDFWKTPLPLLSQHTINAQHQGNSNYSSWSCSDRSHFSLSYNMILSVLQMKYNTFTSIHTDKGWWRASRVIHPPFSNTING